jgi:glycerol kinase
MKKHVLVLDAGTTGVKAFVFGTDLKRRSKAYEAYPVRSPKRGWAEQDPDRLLAASIRVMRKAVKQSGVSKRSIASWGITNQRETAILWDKRTGKPVYPAIVWQDARTKAVCASLKRKWEKRVRFKTGLTLDPYFSASKIWWILKHVPKAHDLAARSQLAFGTVDAWLAWNLCEGRPHVTDATNAARTLLMNIRTKKWDRGLLKLFGVPSSVLPEIKPSASAFGTMKKTILGARLALAAIGGDQQSSFYAAAQTATKKGSVTKVTFGTGTFVMQAIGAAFRIRDPFFTTLIPKGKGSGYALEAKVCVSGPDVLKRLGKPEELKKYFRVLAKRTDAYIKKLPVRPKEIIIDGGCSRDGLMLAIQEEVSGISTQPLRMYDGTALGTAMLQLR